MANTEQKPLLIRDPPQLRMGALVIYYACIIHINLPLESLYLLQKTASKSVAQTDKNSDFVLYYVVKFASYRTSDPPSFAWVHW
uniref:SFRICE_027974 n=1 Tax=Spodoptera frugiperda TaxID=7108 RepID=A0A2H1V6R1_SPOFR